ncbi:hypothetical protein [Nocardioides sp. LHG3406-4]|uniref:hypothetical protein n=1 Tax=Nocardioides sp. LHG3406-4 TaxID=2804575 RepID=UPI003CF6E198
MTSRRVAALVLAALLPTTALPAAPASAGVTTVRSFSIADPVPDVMFGAADADGTRRIEVELKRTEWSHLRLRHEDRLRVRARIQQARKTDAAYRQGLVVEAWRSPERKPPRLVAYAVVFDLSSGVRAVRPDGAVTRCPRARRTRNLAKGILSVTMPAACLRLRGRVKLVAVTYLDSYGPAGWGRAASDRSVLSKALRYPRRLR